MNIYLVSRYGSEMFVEELDSELECTKDSNLLVRAKNWGRASEIANEYLRTHVGSYPAFQKILKSGEMLCDYIVQIGTDSVNETEEVIHGPFLSHAIIMGKHARETATGTNSFKSWKYDRLEKEWRKIRLG